MLLSKAESVLSGINQSSSNDSTPSFWAIPVESVIEKLQTDSEIGLSQVEAQSRLKSYGYNQLRKHQKKSVWLILWEQLKSLIILLLAVAAAVSFLYGEILEGWAILVVIMINTAIGFFTEIKAVRSMEALLEMGTVDTRVRRAGEVRAIDARKLVPGDVVIFDAGDIVTADLRIIESSKLQADESALTGESLPVGKEAETQNEEAVLAERKNMLYKGTAVTRGAGEGVVVSTGLETELGHISSLVEEAEKGQTPLEVRLDKLGHRLIGLTLIIAVFVTLSGIISGKEIYLMIETGIALAVAAIPEGLPVVATIALAKGMQVMADKNALINRLSSVETLGATGIIFSDKTGTLTENKMTVTQFLFRDQKICAENFNAKEESGNRILPLEDNKLLKLAIETGILCNNASVSADDPGGDSGDPLEVALLRAGRQAGYDYRKVAEQFPEVKEEAFDAEVKMMATWNQCSTGKYRVSVKGAPEAVWEHCNTVLTANGPKKFKDDERRYWESINAEMAANGLRIIALAYRDTNTTEEDPYQDLTFIGLVTLQDPPRKEVRAAIKKCQEAGIRVVMVTGDQKETARYISRQVGIETGEGSEVLHGSDLSVIKESGGTLQDQQLLRKTNTFARISPQQKLDLIEHYQRLGEIVAMTGDGVNDAPALKKADIGIAMGQRGTQVAKEASDMVLIDDAFSTIVSAIEQGRIIFGNIRRFVYYLLSCNVSEVLVVGLATTAGAPLPLLPLQILFLNLVTDVFPALALGVGEGEEGVMERPPRSSDEPILGKKEWIGIGGYALLITAAVLGALYLGLRNPKMTVEGAVTLSFLTLAFAQLWHVFNMRTDRSGFWDNMIVRNPFIWGALLLCTALILAAIYIPALAQVLQIVPPDFNGWLIIITMSLVPYIVGQAKKLFSK